MQPEVEHIRKLVQAIYPLTEAEWLDLEKIWTPVSYKRKEIVTMAGEKEKYLYFVLEGVQRVVYLDEQDREATLVFTYPYSFGGVLDALMQQQPSRYFYETLTPSSFLRAPFAHLQELMDVHPNISTMIRKGITAALSGVLERIVELQCFSSEEKFRKLMQRSPHILQLVPHKYLANYLGIDPSNFSKLINSVKI
ncbi:MAG: Crp/Fnr family transcriptional regulator [Sphingobacteriales bacterium]|nr:Crp/Fnr family transcriptional regulator [Sphingobacteriales bacterium]OJY91866.1 MAG: cyclic nucleotide-binding protein [Sphingobacteriales bacterium 44-15]